jgi:hypothetical protein
VMEGVRTCRREPNGSKRLVEVRLRTASSRKIGARERGFSSDFTPNLTRRAWAKIVSSYIIWASERWVDWFWSKPHCPSSPSAPRCGLMRRLCWTLSRPSSRVRWILSQKFLESLQRFSSRSSSREYTLRLTPSSPPQFADEAHRPPDDGSSHVPLPSHHRQHLRRRRKTRPHHRRRFRFR